MWGLHKDMCVLRLVTRDEPTSPECGRMSLTTFKGEGGGRGVKECCANHYTSTFTPRAAYERKHPLSVQNRTNMEYSIRAASVEDCKDIARMIMVSGRIRGHTGGKNASSALRFASDVI